MEPSTSIVRPLLCSAPKSSSLRPPAFAIPGHPMASPVGTLSSPLNTIGATECTPRKPDLKALSKLLNVFPTIVLLPKDPLPTPPSAPLALSPKLLPTLCQPPSPKSGILSSSPSRNYPASLTIPSKNLPLSRRPRLSPGLRRFLLHLRGCQYTPHHLRGCQCTGTLRGAEGTGIGRATRVDGGTEVACWLAWLKMRANFWMAWSWASPIWEKGDGMGLASVTVRRERRWRRRRQMIF